MLIYLNPEYFSPSLADDTKKGSSFNRDIVEKYWKLLTAIDWFVKKISKYPLYFNEFYTSNEKVSNHEALEHHIYAYLEDMETVKNKIVRYITEMKNDIKKVAINKKEVDEALKQWVKDISRVFGSSKLRGDLRHGNYRFVDPYISKAYMAETILNQEELFSRLTEKGVVEVKKNLTESIEEGKNWWSENAKYNYQQIYGLTNKVIEKTKYYLYQLLDIEVLIPK